MDHKSKVEYQSIHLNDNNLKEEEEQNLSEEPLTKKQDASSFKED